MVPYRKIALIIGIGGGIGGAVANTLLRRGWKIRALVRDPDKIGVKWPPAVELIQGDAMYRTDVVEAACGTSVIFHSANPPMYRNWRQLSLPMLANSISAAEDAGARLVFPGNLYNFGPDAGPVVDETSPQNPLTRKGAIRVEMEAMLRTAAQSGVIRALVVRAGDYFGGAAHGSWFAQVIVPKSSAKPVRYPGRFDTGHSWAYLPDLAEAIARLIDQEQRLPPWETVHFGGHWLGAGVEMAETVRRVQERQDKVRPFHWWPFILLSPFSPFLREVLEMRYLWRTSLRLANGKLLGLIGEEPHTPLAQAVRVSITALKRGGK